MNLTTIIRHMTTTGLEAMLETVTAEAALTPFTRRGPLIDAIRSLKREIEARRKPVLAVVS